MVVSYWRSWRQIPDARVRWSHYRQTLIRETLIREQVERGLYIAGVICLDGNRIQETDDGYAG